MMSMSIMLLFMNHPLTVGLMLMIQTIMTSLITGMLSKFWFSYILFMIMVGGLMVMFIYMTSISSNKKFKFSWKLSIFMAPVMMIILVVMIIMDYMETLMMSQKSELETNILKYIEYPMNSIMIMMMIYMLLALIAIVKITQTNWGPLRQK
uniref:NADH-ubiquinone oxidoreductase chain 6 n=1 Tax=Dictyoptera aurora TaxID=1053893 RepID=A0A0S2MN91_9COLE|nr:NADH deshydrogenase subunit 6 [Dictyoptera aurora]